MGGTPRLENHGPQSCGGRVVPWSLEESRCGATGCALDVVRYHAGQGNTEVGLVNWSEGNYFRSKVGGVKGKS